MSRVKVNYRFNGRSVANAHQFGQAIKASVVQKAWELQLAYAVELAEEFADGTPVRSGHARSWWSVANPGNHPSYSPTIIGPVSVDTTGARDMFRPLTIQNPVKYIMNLEMGDSDQAPAGMVRLALANHDQYFAAAARRVRNGA